MNLASRLQAAAQPGTVVVGERVRRLAGDQFEYEDLGELQLKGVSGVTRIIRVLGVRETESRFEAATRRGMASIIGREEEIGLLVDVWRQVCESASGRAMVLTARPASARAESSARCANASRPRSSRAHLFSARPSSSTALSIRSEPGSNGRWSSAATKTPDRGSPNSRRSFSDASGCPGTVSPSSPLCCQFRFRNATAR